MLGFDEAEGGYCADINLSACPERAFRLTSTKRPLFPPPGRRGRERDEPSDLRRPELGVAVSSAHISHHGGSAGGGAEPQKKILPLKRFFRTKNAYSEDVKHGALAACALRGGS